ncbi:MAG: 50S ribosomal protein L9 [Lachnospiraceae bacterium]|jgi:large subunit ribosomal protein L9|nr:50S ribosomal protein L9 [Lachnospiraceae bacterium]MEE3460615.1 50S ribosomal protein L9 [Lachnospiraceae bacterium]
MEVILIQDVRSLGKKGDRVNVNDGYARNFLLKKKLALEANAKNLNDLKLQKAHEEKVEREKTEAAEALVKELADKSISLRIKTGSNGRSFGSISTKEIAEEIKRQLGYEFDKKKMELDVPIKGPGAYNVTIRLHKQISGTIKVNVSEA